MDQERRSCAEIFGEILIIHNSSNHKNHKSDSAECLSIVLQYLSWLLDQQTSCGSLTQLGFKSCHVFLGLNYL